MILVANLLIKRDRGDTLSLLVQFLLELCVCLSVCVCQCVCVCVCIYQIAHNRANQPCRASLFVPIALMCVCLSLFVYFLNCVYVCMCVCVLIKLHITAQSGPVILVILCHSH